MASHSVWRKCLSCNRVVEKGPNFVNDEFRCQTCFRLEGPSRGMRETSSGVEVRGVTLEEYLRHNAGPRINPDDLEQWRKLFNYIDEDRSGQISSREVTEKMSKMLGQFRWEDGDGDGEMDMDEFVVCMSRLNANLKHSALTWAKNCLGPGGRRQSMSKGSKSATGGAIDFDIPMASYETSSGMSKVGSIRSAAGPTADEIETWRKLFNHIDEDRSGQIGAKELSDKMSKMLGQFDWADGDGDGQMDFDEFVKCMHRLKPSVKHSALQWAKQCLTSDGKKASFRKGR